MPLSVSSEVDSPTVNGIREMSQVRLEKRQKAWLVEAVCACMAHIDLIESKDGNDEVRLELRELKKAVFVNASHGSAAYTQDTQDYMDRADTGWDAILKLAAEQTQEDGDQARDESEDETVKDKGKEAPAATARPSAASAGTSAAAAATAASAGPSAASAAASAPAGTSATAAATSKAKDNRQICPKMWAGEFCGGCSGYKHPAACQDKSHCSRRDRPASCKLWHLSWTSGHWTSSNNRRGTTGSSNSSSGDPRTRLGHVHGDVVLAAKHEKLKKYVAEMEQRNHRRKEDEKTQRACVAAVTLSQRQQPQPQSAWGPPPGSTPPPAASLPTSSSASPPDWAAALLLSFQQLQQRVDSRLGPCH
jgi:hypothetical protein